MKPLTDVQARVLGAMIEKCHTTPDYYPMTLNALVNACNQKSNRHPVTDYDERTVETALAQLRERSLIFKVFTHDSRVIRYKQSLAEELALDGAQEALLCVLLLRGPQTAGELRGRTGRLHTFETPAEVEQTLAGLMALDPPLVARLPRPVGKRACPYGHLLCGEPEAYELEPPPAAGPAPTRATASHAPEDDRIAQLEQELAALREEFEALRQLVERAIF